MICRILLLIKLTSCVCEESDVTGSHEPVHVTVGHDVILPCHLEPPFDVTTLTVEWRRNKVIVHVYRNRKDDPSPQNETFRGRTSLFHDELIRGNISLKLTNVTEQDEGNYSCFVPKLDSQVRRGFIKLIVDTKTEENENNNNHRHHGFIVPVVIIPAILTIVAIGVIRTRRVNNNAKGDGKGGHEEVKTDDSGDKGRDPGAGAGGRGQHELTEVVEVDDSRYEGQVKDETGEDNTNISLTQQKSTLRDSNTSSPHT